MKVKIDRKVDESQNAVYVLEARAVIYDRQAGLIVCDKANYSHDTIGETFTFVSPSQSINSLEVSEE